MTTVLGIVSGKGGTGKSTVSCGLAIAFANMYKRVLLVDLDEGLRCLDLMMGVERDVVYDLGDVLSGQDVSSAIYVSPVYSNIKIVPAPHKTGTISGEALSRFISDVSKSFDIIIFDFPSGADFSLCKALGKYARFITVSNMDPVSIRDAAVVCDNLSNNKIPPRLIINRFDADYIRSGIYKNIDSIIDDSGLRLLGLIPKSSALTLLSVNHSLKTNKRAYKSLNRIARRIIGEDVKLPKINKI